MSHSSLRIASILGASAAVLALAITPPAHADPRSAHPTATGRHPGHGRSHGSSAHHGTSPGKSASAPGRAHGNPTPGTPPAQPPGQAQAPGQQPAAGAGDPWGNNGTVKISLLGDHDGTPNNVPHPGCTFEVQWYGYDAGSDTISTVAFTAQAPTLGVSIGVSGPTQVQVGGDPASGAGTPTGLDAVQDYVLSFSGAAPAKQGYHVRVTVSTPHSLGNDTKTKVFWVEPCTAAPTPGGSTSSGDQQSGTATTPAPGAATPVSTGQLTGGASAGRVVLTSGVPTVVEAGLSRADRYVRAHTPWPLVVAGLGTMLLSLGVARMRRRA